MDFKEVLQEILRRSILLQDPGVKLQPKLVTQLVEANAADARALLTEFYAAESKSETPQQAECRLREARARFLLCGNPATH
ncbi:MAG: hypothetical protein ACN6OP_30285 [Pseudomonadales bacterium]